MESDPWIRKCFLFLGGHMDVQTFTKGSAVEEGNVGPQIGSGSSKFVHQLTDSPGRCVAFLKGQPSDKNVSEFLKEAAKTTVVHYILNRIIQRTESNFRPRYYARVMQCFQVGLNPRPYMILEYIPSTLEREIKTNCSDEGCTDEGIFESQRLFAISLYQLAKTLNLLYKEIKFVHADLKINNVGVIVDKADPCSSTAVLLDFGFSSFRVNADTCALFGLQGELDIGPPGKDRRLLNNDIAYLLMSTYKIWNEWIDSPRLLTSLTVYFDLVHDNIALRLIQPQAGRMRITDSVPVSELDQYFSQETDQRAVLAYKRWSIDPRFSSAVYYDDGEGYTALPDHLNQMVQLAAVKGILTSFASLQCVRDMIDDSDGYLSKKNEKLASLIDRLTKQMVASVSNQLALSSKLQTALQDLEATKTKLTEAVEKTNTLESQLQEQNNRGVIMPNANNAAPVVRRRQQIVVDKKKRPVWK